MDNNKIDNRAKLLYGLATLIIIILSFITYDLINTVEKISLKSSENFKIVQLAKEETARQELEVRKQEIELKKQTISKTENRDAFIICIDTVMTKSVEAKQSINAEKAKEICLQVGK